jgi:hypothetical protein
LAKVESEYFPVHLRLEGHQYAYYCWSWCCWHEPGTPSPYMNKVHADRGTQRSLNR